MAGAAYSGRQRGRLIALLALVVLALAAWFVLGLLRTNGPEPAAAPPAQSRPALAPPSLVNAAPPSSEGGPLPPRSATPAAPPVVTPPGAPVTPGEDLGRRLFREACEWIAMGGKPLAQVKDLELVMDAKFDLEETQHEGPMHLWLLLPDLYRQEMVMATRTTMRVMNRGNLYVKNAAGAFTHLNRTPDGATSIRQVQDDMERLTDLATFFTLAGLDGPDVTFEFLGEKNPSGAFRRGPDGSTWAKIVRRSPGRPNVYLWLAHEKDAQGVMHATYPGVVRVDGDPLHDIPTQDFLLQDWREAPAGAVQPHRFPRKILAFQMRPGQAPLNFLTASVTDLRLNAGIDPALFEPR